MNAKVKIARRISSALLSLLVHFVTQAAIAQNSTSTSPDAVSVKPAGWPLAVRDNTVFAHVLINQFEGRTLVLQL